MSSSGKEDTSDFHSVGYPPYLPNTKNKIDRKIERYLTSEREEEPFNVGFKCTSRAIYEAWCRTVPRKEIGWAITELMAKDLAEKAGKGQIVLNQSLNQYIHAEPHSQVNITNKVAAKVEVSIEEYDQGLKRYLESWDKVMPKARKQLGEILKKHPELQDLPSAKELLKRINEEAGK